MLALLSGCKGQAHGPAGQAPAQPVATAAAQLYTCSMHPQIVREAPGQCPICGMDLVPKASGGSRMAADTAGADLAHLVTSPNGTVVSAIATVRPTSGAASADIAQQDIAVPSATPKPSPVPSAAGPTPTAPKPGADAAAAAAIPADPAGDKHQDKAAPAKS